MHNCDMISETRSGELTSVLMILGHTTLHALIGENVLPKAETIIFWTLLYVFDGTCCQLNHFLGFFLDLLVVAFL